MRHVRSKQEVPDTGMDCNGRVHDLFMAPGTKTGYKGVDVSTARNLQYPYRARHNKASLGYFATAAEAAIAYSKCVYAQSNLALAEPSLCEGAHTQMRVGGRASSKRGQMLLKCLRA
jgi:hypothetical protein